VAAAAAAAVAVAVAAAVVAAAAVAVAVAAAAHLNLTNWLSLSFLSIIAMTEEYSSPEFIPDSRQWTHICSFNPRRKGKDMRLDAEIRRRLAFSEPWDGIFSLGFRWSQVELFNSPAFCRVADTVRDWIVEKTPATEEAMGRLVWDSTGVGGPELFQRELCCVVQYIRPWFGAMFTGAVIDRLKNSDTVEEWRDFFVRGEIPNQVLYR